MKAAPSSSCHGSSSHVTSGILQFQDLYTGRYLNIRLTTSCRQYGRRQPAAINTIMRNLKESQPKKIGKPSGLLVFLVFVCIMAVRPALSQTYFFDSYGVADGLAQSKIYDLLQDQRGYIWMATDAGVSSFDGHVFRNFSAGDGLAPGAVRVLLEDREGRLWSGHHDGQVSLFDGESFHIPQFSGNELSTHITSLIETETGEIWITTVGNGTIKIINPYDNPDDFTWEHHSGGTISPRIFESHKGRDGTLYFITDMGISTYNRQENIFIPFRPEWLPRYFQITSMFEDSRNNLWFGTYNGGLYKYNSRDDELTIYDARDGLSHNWISCIFEDDEGTIWIGTWGGGITRIREQEITIYDVDNGMTDNMIRAFAGDREGNVLIGTNENGIAIFKGEHLVSYQVADGLVDNQVWAVYQDRSQRFWIGTQAGITLFDPSLTDNEAFSSFTSFDHFSLDRVRFIREDQNGNIWISTDVAGVGMYNTSTGSFRDYTTDFILGDLLPTGSVSPTAMEIDDNNNLWLGTNSFVAWYNIDTGDSGIFTQGAGIAGNDISSLFYDTQGRLWVGSAGRGISVIAENMTASPVELDEHFTPLCMTEDASGNIWIGTESHGVIVTDGGGIVKRLEVADGLLGNYISLIISDDENIYIGASRGLNRYNLKEDRIFTYTRHNGFTGIEAVRNAAYRDKGGRLWFGTVMGAMVYEPAVSPVEPAESYTHFTRLRVNYVDRALQEGLQLSYRENSLIFDYNSISLTNPDAVRFRVILEGADPDWRPVTRETSAIYPGLSPGRYTFRVMATNSQDVWNTEPASFSFRIRPPWYASWWGITSFIIAGIITIVLYIKIREENLIREKRVLEVKVAERTREISEKNILLAMKNKDITDSINYAKRLQDAILPAEEMIDDIFVLFRPKDIVSGDFYWMLRSNGTDMIAAVDCTGHGVPGAFMSLIGHNGLNKVVKEMKITRPGEILDKLNEEVYHTLHQNVEISEGVRDGMDMSLIVYNQDNDIVEYAGAYNSLYLVRNGELAEYKADKLAIGHEPGEQNYSNHEIEIKPGDTLYIFSDGFADQFGGDRGKKFMSKNLKRLLTDISSRPLPEQKVVLEKTLLEWMGNDYEQLDDVLIIGKKF